MASADYIIVYYRSQGTRHPLGGRLIDLGTARPLNTAAIASQMFNSRPLYYRPFFLSLGYIATKGIHIREQYMLTYVAGH